MFELSLYSALTHDYLAVVHCVDAIEMLTIQNIVGNAYITLMSLNDIECYEFAQDSVRAMYENIAIAEFNGSMIENKIGERYDSV